ncbi:hypothetical protein AOQ84DRAFT_441505 [Glonium stellatum]|uniref:Uncharacterized protein n=1 Tax=Glonium stellatum TaxID=574774 RepID=A0A8E2EVD8_9PEZI|nr:hypothetical protein AOQ84DRAFT_441505 [Glonium stellatum]
MACITTLSNSASHSESPFSIPHEDVTALCSSEGFQVLRKYLANNAENTFCSEHDNCDAKARETWLLHRDILHALVMPVVQLFKRATALAEAALCTRRPEDLELAFGGDARSAFLWLQCFLADEDDWCRTRGCPACATTTTLSTESHIRLTIAASLLSTSSTSPSSAPASTANTNTNTNTNAAVNANANPTPPPTPSSSPSSTPTHAHAHTHTHNNSGLSLPPLPHILPALRQALSSDPFWGPDYWPYLLSRANLLSSGIHALIRECGNLEALVSSPPSLHQGGRKRGVLDEGDGTRLRKSRLAKRQLRMKGEEMELLRRRAWQCWAVVAMPTEVRKAALGGGIGLGISVGGPGKGGERRGRSLTCP